MADISNTNVRSEPTPLGQYSEEATGLSKGEQGFDSWQRHRYSLFHSLQTGSGANPASSPKGNEKFSPPGETAGA
jgi:hypothetical protein